mgnify:FL=1
MTPAPPEFRRPLARYIAGVTLAHVMAATEVLLVMAALGHEAHGAIGAMFVGHSAVIVSVVVILAVFAIAIGAAWIFIPTLRWYSAGVEPTAAQRETALAIPRRQTAMLAAVWVISAIPVLVVNRGAAAPTGLLIIPPLVFGTTAAILTALLLTVRALRPITAAALPDDATVDSTHDTAPSVMVRLLSVWVLISALPSFGVAGLILARSNGWLIDRSASLELPILLLMAVGVLWGLRAMILVSQSISDPVRDVVEAMADVGQGNLEHTVSVYERSEVGRLQTGFNRMVIGLRERELLRDLFGRNVGGDVVSLLVNRDESSYGVERDVAVMFIDLAGSTQLAASLPPQQVAELLNTFFQSVVLAVDNHGGFVNKFQGDAALAVFGAPVDSPTAHTDALATARELAGRMRELQELDFGIGVAAGQVFAGFVGALNRFEYTVIGDAVNESARLADRAKKEPGRVLCSAAALHDADTDEREHWVPTTSEVLRGRSAPTEMFAPTA